MILSNVDLTCELVKEFPSLQGKVGGYYASLENFNEVCEAISSQYNQTSLRKLFIIIDVYFQKLTVL